MVGDSIGHSSNVGGAVKAAGCVGWGGFLGVSGRGEMLQADIWRHGQNPWIIWRMENMPSDSRSSLDSITLSGTLGNFCW